MNEKTAKKCEKVIVSPKTRVYYPFLEVGYAKTIDPRTLKFRFLIGKYLDSLPKNNRPCQVIRENWRDQKVKFLKFLKI